jgi:hypothetical protein
MPGVLKHCVSCGKEFFVPPRRSESVKYCSRKCKTDAGWELRKCCVCGAPIRRKRSDYKRSAHTYCSPDCYYAVQRRRRKPALNRPMYFRTCEVCEKRFRVNAQRKNTARFCSRNCQSKSVQFRIEMSAVQSGEKSHRWKGGISRHIKRKPGTPARRAPQRAKLESAMLEMDPNHPFLAVVGGKKQLSSGIDVHHIDRNSRNNALSNLLAVTRDAHARIHRHNRKPDPWECWPPNPRAW